MSEAINRMPLQLPFEECVKILGEEKIVLLPYSTPTSEAHLVSAAKKLGFPLILKVYSPEIIHKSREGFVKTGIIEEKTLRSAYREFLRNLQKRGVKEFSIVVQKEVRGAEFILGSKKDPTFGHIVLLGLGGIHTEAFGKTTIRIWPCSKRSMKMMAQEIISPIAPDKDAQRKAADLIMRVGRLAKKHDITEMDLNPLIISGKDVFVADVRMMR